jgi:glycosyltransferase involved in cell wall biosynthesis
MQIASGAKVSVIIPTYNRALLVKHAIDSVLSQSYDNTEVIVVDDGSTDRTEAVVLSYRESISNGTERIRYFYQPNQGKSAALNRGLTEVRGEWVAFLDSDDRWLPEKLELQLRTVQEWGHACHACFTDARYVNNPWLTMTGFQRAAMHFDGLTGLVRNSTSFLLCEPHGIYVQTLLVRASILEEVGGFDSSLQIFEDKDFEFRLSHSTEFCYVNLPLVEIDRSCNSDDGLMRLAQKEEFRVGQLQYVYEKWLGLDWLGKGHRSAIQSRLSEIHSEWATWHLLNREYDLALRAISRSVAISHSAPLMAKALLMNISPQLARRIVQRRVARRTARQSGRDDAAGTVTA